MADESNMKSHSELSYDTHADCGVNDYEDWSVSILFGLPAEGVNQN